MGTGDDQLHPAQPAAAQAAQERRPEGLVLPVAEVHPQTSRAPSTATPVAMTTARQPPVDPRFDVGGVAEHVANLVWSSGRERKASTCSSRSLQVRDTGAGTDTRVRRHDRGIHPELSLKRINDHSMCPLTGKGAGRMDSPTV
jgi:hypothetical protein